jgi:phage portal protein BeeE
LHDPFASYTIAAGASRDEPPAYEVPAPGVARSTQGGAPPGVYAGSIGYGGGGPTWLDAYHAKRPPTPVELVNAVKAVSYACIKLNAVGVAKVPLRLYAVRRPGQRAPRRSFRRAPDDVQRRIRLGTAGRNAVPTGLSRSIESHDEIDEVLQHPLLDALESPNEFFDRPTLLMYLTACLDSVGAAFLFPERPVGADGLADPSYAASKLWPLQPQYVYPQKGANGELVNKWRYFGDSYDAKELVRVRWFSLRDPYLSGYAPLHACYEQTSVVDYYTASVEAILKGGSRPDVIVGPKDPLQRWNEVERRRFETDIQNRLSGSRKGRVWATDGAFDVHTLSYPPADLGGLELSREQRLLCSNCFDVPISLLQTENSNRATAQESTHQHQYYGIDPRCGLIAAGLTRQLAQPVDDRLFFYFDDPVSRDVEREARVWDMKVKAGKNTLNEWRADDGEPPVEWGDEPRFPNTLVTPSEAEADRSQKAEAAKASAEALASAATAKTLDGPDPTDGDEPGGRPAADEAASAARSLGFERHDALSRKIYDTLDAVMRSLPNDPDRSPPRAADAGPWPDGAAPE